MPSGGIHDVLHASFLTWAIADFQKGLALKVNLSLLKGRRLLQTLIRSFPGKVLAGLSVVNKVNEPKSLSLLLDL